MFVVELNESNKKCCKLLEVLLGVEIELDSERGIGISCR